MVISAKTYELVAIEDDEAQWELDCGRLRRKPEMTIEHDSIAMFLAMELAQQLDKRQFIVGTNTGRLRSPDDSFFIPDLVVIPRALALRVRAEHPHELGVFEDAVPLVVEVWSPSTGKYDLEKKLPAYKQRGDAEIWLIHPYERTLTAWRRQADGSYAETLYSTGGSVEPASLPGVRIVLSTLFE